MPFSDSSDFSEVEVHNNSSNNSLAFRRKRQHAGLSDWLQVKDLPSFTRVTFKVVALEKNYLSTLQGVIVGKASVPVFEYTRQMQKGIHEIKLWPFEP